MHSCTLSLFDLSPGPDVPARLAEAGFSLVNLSADLRFGDPADPLRGALRLASDADLARLRRELKSSGVGIDWVHAPYGDRLSLVSPDNGERAFALASHTFLLEQAARAEARAMVFHAYWRALPGQVGVAQAKDWLVGAFGQLASRARRLGVAACLENLTAEGCNLFTDAVLEEVPDLWLCFDAGHAHLAQNAGRWLPRWRGRVGAVHLHDNPGPGGASEDRHRIPGEGTVPWPEVHALLVRSGYAGPWGLELHPYPNPEAAAAKAYAAVMAIGRGEMPDRASNPE